MYRFSVGAMAQRLSQATHCRLSLPAHTRRCAVGLSAGKCHVYTIFLMKLHCYLMTAPELRGTVTARARRGGRAKEGSCVESGERWLPGRPHDLYLTGRSRRRSWLHLLVLAMLATVLFVWPGVANADRTG